MERDKCIENFFESSRQYRMTSRCGDIAVVDNRDRMFSYLSLLIPKFDRTVRIIHAKTGCEGKRVIQNSNAIRGVIIADHMLGDSLNNDSFVDWMGKNYPEIPIWVFDCPSARKSWIRQQTQRLGVCNAGTSVMDIIKFLGLNRQTV